MPGAPFPGWCGILAGDLGKQIVARSCCGEETELDRHVLELIRAPADPHGPQLRRSRAGDRLPPGIAVRQAGACGTIKLNSYHEGGTVVVEVLRRRCRACRPSGSGTGRSPTSWWRRWNWQTWTERPDQPPDLHARLHDGRSAITAVSGRGVGHGRGADQHRTARRHGGRAEHAGKRDGVHRAHPPDARHHLRTDRRRRRPAVRLAASLHRRAGPGRAGPDCRRQGHGWQATSPIERVDGTPVLRLRDKLLPLVSLAKLLGLPAESGPASGRRRWWWRSSAGCKPGCWWTRCSTRRRSWSNPSRACCGKLQVFSGNTILGDGSVIMILDPSGLSHAIGQGSAHQARTKVCQRAAGRRWSAPNDRSAMLLVRLTAGGVAPWRCRSGWSPVSRASPRADIQQTPERSVTRYRDHLMPLVGPSNSEQRDGPVRPVRGVLRPGPHRRAWS